MDKKGPNKRTLAFEFRGSPELDRIREFVLQELQSRGIVSVDNTLTESLEGLTKERDDTEEVRHGQNGQPPEPYATLTLEWNVSPGAGIPPNATRRRERIGKRMSNCSDSSENDITHLAIAREGAMTQRSRGDSFYQTEQTRGSHGHGGHRHKDRDHNDRDHNDRDHNDRDHKDRDQSGGSSVEDKKSIWESESSFAPYDEWPDKRTWQWYRMWLHFTMEKESFSAWALLIFSIVMILILVSTLAYCLATIPSIEAWAGWDTIEALVSISFTVELFFRVVACRNAWKFWDCKTFYFYNFLNFVDLLAIAPFYIEMAFGSGQSWIRVVRIIRLARIARAFGSESMREFFGILAGEFKKTWRQSVTMVSMLVILETCVCASLIYVVEKGTIWPGVCSDSSSESEETCCTTNGGLWSEKGEEDSLIAGCTGGTGTWVVCPIHEMDKVKCGMTGAAEAGTDYGFCRLVNRGAEGHCFPKSIREDGVPTPFISIPEAMYWVMSTMTTVGYGDLYPITVMGKIVAAVTMLTGVLVVAVFIIVVGANFDQTAKIVRRLNYKKEMASALAAQKSSNAASPASPRAEGVTSNLRGEQKPPPKDEDGIQMQGPTITPAPGTEKGRPTSE